MCAMKSDGLLKVKLPGTSFPFVTANMISISSNETFENTHAVTIDKESAEEYDQAVNESIESARLLNPFHHTTPNRLTPQGYKTVTNEFLTYL